MVGTRSDKNKDLSSDNDNTNSSYDIEDILLPLRESIKGISKVLDIIEERFENKFRKQQSQINNLQTRIALLEKKAEFNHHLAKLNERKIDDGEQFSKRINLKIEGVSLEINETSATLMEKIQSEIDKLGLQIPHNAYDRCHRDGPLKTYKGKKQQSILLKMKYWSDRDAIYANRKKLVFNVYPHLTARRSEILYFAKDQVNSADPSLNRNIDFVFVDRICRLMVRTKSGKFYGFNSENEFLTLVSWIAKNEVFADFEKGFETYIENGPGDESSGDES